MNKFIFSGFFLFLTFSMKAQLVNSGATIVIESGAKLIVEGDVSNTGTITNNGELEIQGNLDNDNIITNAAGSRMIFSGSGNSVITSTSVLDIKELVLNKTGGATTSLDPVGGNDILLSFALDFGANNFLNISNFDLTLGGIANPILNAANDRFIITNGSGTVIRPNLNNAASFTFPVGFSATEYNPVTVTNNGVAANIGARSLAEAYSTGDDTNSAPAPDAVTASWEITGGGDLDVEFNWDGADVPGSFDASRSGVSRWDDVNGFWDLTIEDGLGVVGTTAGRAGVAPGIFSVGGESVMDYILVLPKVYLSGPWNGTDMNASLTAFLPNSDPYPSLGYSHTILGSGAVASVPFDNVDDNKDIVDWVFLEIRDEINNTDIIATYSALLQRNGDIVAPNGGEVKIPGLKAGINYYVVVKHRNHLGIMTNSATTLNRTISNLAFNNGSLSTYSLGAPAQNTLGVNIYGMIPGDADINGSVNALDYIFKWRLNNGQPYDYIINGSSDFDMNGSINALDYIFEWRPNNSKTQQLPSN